MSNHLKPIQELELGSYYYWTPCARCGKSLPVDLAPGRDADEFVEGTIVKCDDDDCGRKQFYSVLKLDRYC